MKNREIQDRDYFKIGRFLVHKESAKGLIILLIAMAAIPVMVSTSTVI